MYKSGLESLRFTHDLQQSPFDRTHVNFHGPINFFPVLYSFGDMAKSWSKSSLLFLPRVQVTTPLRLGLSHWSVIQELWCATMRSWLHNDRCSCSDGTPDGQTDRQKRIQRLAYTALAYIASRGTKTQRRR